MDEPQRTPTKPAKVRNTKKLLDASELSAVGIEMVIAVAIGAYAGWWVDQKLASSPIGVLIGLALGIGAAVKALIRVNREFHRRLRRQDSAGKPPEPPPPPSPPVSGTGST